MSCHEAQRLMAFYMKDDPTLSRQEREDFERHVLVCPSCAREYEEEKRLEVFLEAYWAVSRSNQKAEQDLERKDGCDVLESVSEPLSVGTGLESPIQSGPRLVETYRRGERTGRRIRVAWQVGVLAAVACILIALGVSWVMHPGRTGLQAPIAADTAEAPVVLAELVTPDGREPLALNQLITAGAEPQEVLLGGMHRVVMNGDAKAVFLVEPRRTEGPDVGKVSYEIQLAQGELYVEVVPGHPFTVTTSNARLEITGTKFDVVADGETTVLTLLKGSVRFSVLDHPHTAVSVTTGHASTITGRLVPTVPASVDARAATAWARDVALNNAIALADARAGFDLSSLSMISEEFWQYADPPDVETLDYETWRDAHQSPRSIWASLTTEGTNQAINADWIEVLMISGDIWQFCYDPRLPAAQPLATMEPAGITRLARYYGLDEQEIVKALGLPDSILAATSSVQDQTSGQRSALALRRWYDAVVASTPDTAGANGDLQLFSLYASQYLAETRTAAYLWAKNNPEKVRQLLVDKEYVAMLPTPPALGIDGVFDENEWLRQLRDQANAARRCVPAALEWLLAPRGTGCAYQATEQQRLLAELVTDLSPTVSAQHQNPGQ